MAEIYKDPIITKIIDTIKANTASIKYFYYGDPLRVPVSNLPCAIIAKRETRVGNLTNAEDEHGIQMTITVVTDIRSELHDDKQLVAGFSSLYDIVEGREETTYKLKTSSLLHILRNNVGLDPTNNLRIDLNTITRVDYGMTVNKRDSEAWALEGEIEFVAHFTQIR